ncbi:MAG: YdcF family protein [Bdellovibrionales bacterium]|nr:YdcF family protein [Bdellovibrionales bacterium]
MGRISRFFAFLLTLVATVVVTTAVFLWFAAGEIYDYEDTFEPANPPKVDVVVCLAGGKRRIPVAVELWQKLKLASLATPGQKPPVLFFSGVGPHANLATLVEQGVPADAVKSMKRDEVVFENVSENTYENAQLFASFARQNRWKSIVLVTADYHIRRAEFILRKTLDPGVEIYTSTVDAVHFGRNEWHNNAYAIRVTLIEYIKWLYYRYSY